jgi:ABC-type multidrug transport system fused ATPase/permease subunit
VKFKKNQFLNVVSFVLNSSKSLVFAVFFQKLIVGLIPAFMVISISKFIDTVLSVFNNKLDIKNVYPALFSIIVLLFFSLLSEKIIYFANIKITNKLRINLSSLIFKKYASLEYKHLEAPETTDLILRCTMAPETNLMTTFENICNFFSLVLTVLSVVVIVLSYVWWVGILLIVFCIPLFRIALKSGKANYQANVEVTNYNKKYLYLSEVLTGRNSVEERYLFGFEELLNSKWKDNFEKARKILFITEFKWFAKMKSGSLIMSVIALITTLTALPAVYDGKISIGIFIAMVSTVYALVNRMALEFTTLVDNITKGLYYTSDLQEFLNLSEDEGAMVKPSAKPLQLEKIEFKDVSFKYPNTDKYVLKNFSLTIENGKHYAIVGINGAGKTTMVKLLTGLYKEFEGQILINQKNISEYTPAELKSLCSIAYQDFSRYETTLNKNIAIGNINKMIAENAEEDFNKAVELLELNELIDTLPQKSDTHLGKIKKDGVDLSGGQWQKIAIARLFNNPGALKILDEPTAALDPITESKLYEKFEKVFKGKTTLFISHRLGSTKLANVIFVINDGKVQEKGNHEELMNLNGTYSLLYKSQRSWYD